MARAIVFLTVATFVATGLASEAWAGKKAVKGEHIQEVLRGRRVVIHNSVEKPAAEIPKDRWGVAHGNRENWRCLISSERFEDSANPQTRFSNEDGLHRLRVDRSRCAAGLVAAYEQAPSYRWSVFGQLYQVFTKRLFVSHRQFFNCFPGLKPIFVIRSL
jgi:hypothetical protein